MTTMMFCVPCDSQGATLVPCAPDDPDRLPAETVAYRLDGWLQAHNGRLHATEGRCNLPGCRFALKARPCKHCDGGALLERLAGVTA